jgi:hypothetical protein
MPLMHGKSKKAFSHNVESEMHAGKPQDQSLAIAYSVKRKAGKKKMASGGTVESGSRDMNMAEGGMAKTQDPRDIGKGNIGMKEGIRFNESSSMKAPKRKYAEGGEINAKNERRPMPDNTYDDAKMASQNRGNKPAKNDNWLDQPTVEQAQRPSRTPLKHPKMVPQSVYSVRLRDEEDDLQSSAGTNEGPQRQPPEHDNEEGPDRQGPKVRDMEDEHSTHRKPYAKGGEVEQSDYRAAPNKYEDDLTDLPPSEDEGSMNARSHNETGEDRQGPDLMDTEKPHSAHDRMQRDNEHQSEDDYNPASGKHDTSMELAHDMDENDDRETSPDHEDSLVAAIMSKRRMAMQHSDSDIDEQMYMARGGEILEDSPDIHSHGSMDTHEDEDQADLSRNADEDANEEDQASFDALRKENYSETPGLDELDSPMDSAQSGDEEESDSENEHDMISSIRSKMNRQRQFKSR